MRPANSKTERDAPRKSESGHTRRLVTSFPAIEKITTTKRSDSVPANRPTSITKTTPARPRSTVTEKSTPPPELIEPSTVKIDGKSYDLVNIRATGDLLIHTTFDNGRSSARIASSTDSVARTGFVIKGVKSPNLEVLYRVRVDTLKKTSKYFELLLGSESFAEGNEIAKRFAALKLEGREPSEAVPHELPRISITDDDEATRLGGREPVFGDLMRILHGGEAAGRITIPYLATLAVMADRFDCTRTVGRYLKVSRKLGWPATVGTWNTAMEETVRQKILIAWLFDDQVRMASATRELILRGSIRWAADDDRLGRDQPATWWDLQDGIEGELLYRRSCILKTISSLQSHFLRLYTSRKLQCQQYYDSSAACDSYQLGEMIKFFTNKDLLVMDSVLSPHDEYREGYSGDIETVITALRQCPSYQIDQNHLHCGLRTRLIPALDYIQAMLTVNVGIDRQRWKDDRSGTSWESVGSMPPFRLTRSVANDPRMRVEGYLMAEKHAKALFTASEWDWTPEG